MYNRCWIKLLGVSFQNHNYFYTIFVFLFLVITDIQSINTPVRIKKALAQHVCKQTSAFISLGTIQQPQTKQPDDVNGVECGWYTFQDCSGEKCNIEPFKACGNSTAGSGEHDDPEKNPLGFMTGRIVGGKEAKPHSYPSIVAMYIDGALKCAGSILNPEWVLSASHCVSGGKYELVAGMHEVNKNNEAEQVVKATTVIKHEKYEMEGFKNDIALFKVSPKFKLNDKVQACTLPSNKQRQESGMVTAVGWGRLKQGGAAAKVLQEVDLPVLPFSECQGKADIREGMMCTLQPGGGKDACQGDSGGPLYAKESRVQVGIVSWGIGCAKPDNPGIFTDISYYIDWIQDKMNS